MTTDEIMQKVMDKYGALSEEEKNKVDWAQLLGISVLEQIEEES
jgi:hypothetical protein